MKSTAEVILDKFQPLIEQATLGFTEDMFHDLHIPVFSPGELFSLCNDALQVCLNKTGLIKLSKWSGMVVGDIHGNLLSLLRLIGLYGMPPSSKYLFLGDYIDFGDFSTEVVVLLLALKCKFPDNVVLLQGLSETNPTNVMNGFCDEIMGMYSMPKLYDKFISVFAAMPLAALINDSGICTGLRVLTLEMGLKNLESMNLPLKMQTRNCFHQRTEFDDHISDDVCNKYLFMNGLDYAILGGDSDNGILQTACDNRCVTISICEDDVDVAVILLTEDQGPAPFVYRSAPCLPRTNAVFGAPEEPDPEQAPSHVYSSSYCLPKKRIEVLC